MLLFSSVRSRFERGVVGSTRPAQNTRISSSIPYELPKKIAEHSCQKPDEVLDIYFVATIVNFNVFSIEVNGVRLGRVNSGGKLVSGIARDVVCKHENDIRVRNTEAFYCSVPIGWKVFVNNSLALIAADKKRTSRECLPYAAGTRMSVPCLIWHS